MFTVYGRIGMRTAITTTTTTTIVKYLHCAYYKRVLRTQMHYNKPSLNVYD